MTVIGLTSSLILFACSLLGIHKRRHADTYLLVGVLLRFVSVVYYCLMKDADPDGYGFRALAFANMPLGTLFANFQTGAYLYSWLISFPYRVFGPDDQLIRAINGFLYCRSLFIVCDLSYELYGPKVSKKASLFVAIFPALIRFAGPFASREALFVWLVLASIKFIYHFYINGDVSQLILAVMPVVLACIVHTSAFMLFVLVLLILMNSCEDKGMKILIGVLGLCFVGGGVALMFSKGIGTEKLYLDQGGMNLEKMNWISESSADGRAAYLKGFTFTNPILTALFLPVRVAFFLYAPFIWMVRNALDIFGFVDALLYIVVTIQVYRNIQRILKEGCISRKDRFVLFLGLTLLCMLAMFAIGTSNYGTALRHRAKLISIFVLIAGPYIDFPIHLVKHNEI